MSYTNRTERAAVVRQVAARLGEVSRAGDGSQNSAPRYDATGYAKREGLLLELGWVSFRDATTGLPALVDWVCEKRCRNLKYDVHFGPSLMDELEE